MAAKLNVSPVGVIKSDLTDIFKTGFTSIEIWRELVAMFSKGSCQGDYKRIKLKH